MLTAFLSEKLGHPVTHVGHETLSEGNRPGARRYARHVFRRPGRNDPLLVFAKWSASIPPFAARLESFLSGLDGAAFRVPAFLGAIEAVSGEPQGVLGGWEYVPTEPRVSERAFRSNGDAVVRAAAAMAGLTEALRREVPNLRRAPHFLARPGREAAAREKLLRWGLDHVDHLAA